MPSAFPFLKSPRFLAYSFRTAALSVVAGTMLGTALAAAETPLSSRSTIAQLTQAAGSSNVEQRLLAVELIAEQAPAHASQAVPALVQRLSDDDAFIRQQALAAIARFGSRAGAAVIPVTGLLSSKQRTIALEAIMTLGQIGPEAKNIAPQLDALAAKTDDPFASLLASAALAKILPDDAQRTAAAGKTLVAALGSEDPRVRGLAAAALEGLGTVGVASLVTALNDKDSQVVRRAAEVISRLGPIAKTAGPPLVGVLGSTDPQARRAAATAIGSLGETAQLFVGELAKRLEDEDPQVRAATAQALGRLGRYGINSAGALAKLAADPDPRVRAAAIAALPAVGGEAGVVLPAVAQALGDAEVAVLVPALRDLAQRGAHAVPVLIDAVKNPKTQYWALVALESLGDAAKSAAPEVTKLITSPEPEVRLQALMCLAAIGPDDADAAKIIKALDDPESSVRNAATYALGKLDGKAAAEATPLLRERTNATGDEMNALLSAWALARINGDDPQALRQALPKLGKALTNPNPRVRALAARELAELEIDPKFLVPRLVAALNDSDPAVMRSLVDALAKVGAPAVQPLVEAIAQPAHRLPAVLALSQLGTVAEPAIPKLLAVLKEKDLDPEVNREVLFALAAIGAHTPEALQAMVDQLKGNDDSTRLAAGYALGRIGTAAKPIVGKLRSTLETDDAMLRAVCAWSLVQIAADDPETARDTLPILIKALVDSHPLVRLRAAEAVGQLGKSAVTAIPALTSLRDDTEPEIREAADAALAKIR